MIYVLIGFALWLLFRVIIPGFYTVDQNERAVRTQFGRADRFLGRTTAQDPMAELLKEEERERYEYSQMQVIPAGGPYFKFPWQKIHKVSIATQTVTIGYDPETPSANQSGQVLEAVTKDQLNVGLMGQIRFNVSEKNLYAFIFGVKNPIAHVMGYFISILRERIANFQAPGVQATSHAFQGVSINDLRKNLSDIGRHMETECRSSVARYGVSLDAALITGIEPPAEVESALAAINTAHNQVYSEVSLAQAGADQRIEQSKKAVEIETLRAQAEVEVLEKLASELKNLKSHGKGALENYLRNVRLPLFGKAHKLILEVDS